ncbi:MAG: ThiF family adenylyltransferase [Anaerolineae bacterium]|jgi:molybdopterin/thiamine biosynthesis adenylyltransferase|nr:ThiF family adenylyltransferase [Anaerolineae bacterium]
MTDWDRVRRLMGEDNLTRLRQAHIAVVGLGSGGGFVALSLAMSGVGRFTLVDPEELEPVNLTRHVADSRYLGWNKAEAMADLIRHRNPDAQITVAKDDILKHPELLDGIDLLVVGVDGEGTKYKLNELCLARNVTAIYAGVYARGEGGDTCIIRPYDGPCYACWAAELRDGMGDQSGEEMDYGLIQDNGTLKAEPALWVHVVRVAAAQADLALSVLLGGARPALPANTLVMANQALEIVAGQTTPAHSGVWANIARDPHCLVCGDRLRVADQSISLDDLSDMLMAAPSEDDTDSAARRLEDEA